MECNCNTIQYNTIQYNTIQYNTIQVQNAIENTQYTCNSDLFYWQMAALIIIFIWINCACRKWYTTQLWTLLQKVKVMKRQGSSSLKNVLQEWHAYNYKNNGAVSGVGADFIFICSLYLPKTQLLEVWLTWNKKEYLSWLNCGRYIILL